MNRARVPVVVLAGERAADRRVLVARWLDSRPSGERWALLIEGGIAAVAMAFAAQGDETGPGQEGGPGVVAIALGGCVCCTAATVLRVTLTRLLRKGGLDRILIVVGAAARPTAIAAMLTTPPFDAVLELHAPLPQAEAQRRSTRPTGSASIDAPPHVGT